MSTYLSPGVYIEEVPSGGRPIEAVGTSTAAFVDVDESGSGITWRRAAVVGVVIAAVAAGVVVWRRRARRNDEFG